MSARHHIRLNIDDGVGDWLIVRNEYDKQEARHYHPKSNLVWQVEHVRPGVYKCETCPELVPPGIVFMLRTLKLHRAATLDI